jgi:hypothetical protein
MNTEQETEDKQIPKIITAEPEFITPELIYYNILVDNDLDKNKINDFGTPVVIPKLLELNITNSSVILENPSEYEISVIRFELPSTLPLFIYPVNGSDIYRVQFTYLDYETNSGVDYINYISGNLYPRGVFYINHFLQMVNTAIKQTYDNFIVNAPLLPAQLQALQAVKIPYFEYDVDTELIVFIISEVYLELEIFVRLTPDLHNIYFQAIQARSSYNFPNEIRPYESFYPIQLFPLGDPIQTANGKYFFIESEFNNTPNLNQLAFILFESDIIPVVPEITQSSRDIREKIIMDFSPPQDSPDRTKYTYAPILYRYYNMKSNVPLKSIQLKIGVKYLTSDTIYPMFLQGGEIFSAKILFRKKEKDIISPYIKNDNLSINKK